MAVHTHYIDIHIHACTHVWILGGQLISMHSNVSGNDIPYSGKVW